MSRVLSFNAKSGHSGFGLATTDGVIDASARVDDLRSVKHALQLNRLDDILALENETPDYSLDEITFQPVVANPGKILCIGVNYQGRAAEYMDKSDADYPSVFPRFASSFTGHEQSILRPPESAQLDYEGEIVVVIGKAGRRIPIESARHHIAGLTLSLIHI